MNTFADFPFSKLKKIFGDQSKKEESKNNLNIFKIISKKYHHENFHSDIIYNLLCDKRNKIDGKNLMGIFVDCLNEVIVEQKLDCNAIHRDKMLEDFIVEKEKSNIDISIKSKIADTAIIIENKINNAPDQDNQIPRYYFDIKNDNFENIYIVYLPLTKYKYPDKSTWRQPKNAKSEDKWRDYIENHLIHLPVYLSDNTSTSLLNKWVDKYIQYKIKNSSNGSSDSLFILKQYRELLISLGKEKLNMGKSKELFKLVKSSDNLNFGDIKELVKAYKKIPEYLACNMSDHFSKELKLFYSKNNVFDSTKRGSEHEWAFKLDKPQKEYKEIPNVLRFSFRENKIKIHLWANSEGTGKPEEIAKLKSFLDRKLMGEFEENLTDERKEYVKTYTLKKYDEMVDFVKNQLVPKLK